MGSVKMFFVALGLLVAMLLIIEAVQLGRLWASIGKYATYWQAQQQKAGDITYVALGDSAAQGIGASAPEKGYVGIVAREIEQRTGDKVRIVNLSKSGAKIKDVLDTQLPQLDKYQPDYVTIEIGANNVVAYDKATFEREFNTLVDRLPAGTIVANMPYFGGSIRRDGEVRSANNIIHAAVAGKSLELADLYTITKENNGIRTYAADLFHPSDRGHRNWARAFIKQL